MGHKTHPIGFRLGVVRDWQSHWFAAGKTAYKDTLLEDLRIRRAVFSKYTESDISRVEIERNTQELVATIYTARPGIIIGRQGQRVDELRQSLESFTQKKVRINVQEIRQPETDATLVGQNIAGQLARRVSHRRAMLQAANRSMQAGVHGIKIMVAGRLGGAEIARKDKLMLGRVPLHTLKADIDFAVSEASTMMGKIGVKVWIYKGDIVPRIREREAEEMGMIHVTVKSGEGEEEPQIATTEEG